MNDELEEYEDLHNKMKYDHMISDEQITADNAKISTLETNISAKSASVAQLTDEIDMLENDSKQVQVFRCDRASQQSTTEDIDHNSKRCSYCSKEHQTYLHGLLQSKNMLNRAMKVSCEYVPQYVSQGGEALGVLKQPLEGMSSDIVAAEAAELEHKKTFDEVSDAKNEEIAANTQQF